jgi:hypothetical protein
MGFAWTFFSSVFLSLCLFSIIFSFTYLDYAHSALDPFSKSGAVVMGMNDTCSWTTGPQACSNSYSCGDMICESMQDEFTDYTTISFGSLKCKHMDINNKILWSEHSQNRILTGMCLTAFILLFAYFILGCVFLCRPRSSGDGLAKVLIMFYVVSRVLLLEAMVLVVVISGYLNAERNVPDVIFGWDLALHISVFVFFSFETINTTIMLATRMPKHEEVFTSISL